MKVSIVDLETTGVDPNAHEIVEIGMVLFDSARPHDHETVSIKVLPEHIETGSPEAFKVNGYDAALWAKEGVPLVDALKAVQQKASGAIFMSYNITFDWSFMREAYKKSPLRDPFNYHRFCLMTYAWSKLPTAPTLKLKDMCARLGIEPEPDVHRALEGALRAYRLYLKLNE